MYKRNGKQAATILAKPFYLERLMLGLNRNPSKSRAVLASEGSTDSIC